MPLTPGTRLGPYEIVSPLGAGGMGEVYRARDTRLGREVAVKVLPSHLSDDPARRERFEREARAVSSLNHPHICVLFDIGVQDGIDYLVMEHLEGETLAGRLTKGPLPPAQALRHAFEIADALDKAHRHGVIHRDLKPANVMLTKSGAKLLDFGLAKLHEGASGGPGGGGGSLAGGSILPTATRDLTAEGAILGTFQYMAPEQLEGKEADARTDIFAFGVLVYEMATGRKAFEGGSQASLIAAIMGKDPPPIASLVPMAPPALDRVVRRCLEKDSDERWQSARDLAHELRWIAESEAPAGEPARAGGQAGKIAAPGRRGVSPIMAVAGVVLAGAAMLALGLFLRPKEKGPAPTLRASLTLPPKERLDGQNAALDFSPDGRTVAFTLRGPQGRSMLWVRPLDSLRAQPLAGTEGASYPFWSPDGRSIGFFADRKLKKIPASGGAVLALCEAPDGRGATWNRSGVIVFAPDAVGGLSQVPEAGGAPTSLTTVASAGATHRLPRALPDGRRVLFFSGASASAADNGIYSLDLSTKQVTLLVRENSEGQYAAPGYLVFVRQGNLMAQRFDAETLELQGEAVPIAEKVRFNQGRWTGSYAVSDTGLLLYQGGDVLSKAQLTWFDLAGTSLATAGEPASIARMRLSPDGRRAVAAVLAASGESVLWVYDLVRGLGSRLTFGPDSAYSPVWSPDGQRVAYSNDDGQILVKGADGASDPEVILADKSGNRVPIAWSRDGGQLVFGTRTGKSGQDLWILPMEGDRTPRPFIASAANESSGAFSPDGRWFAYRSDESGRYELYIVPFPGPGGKWQLSTGGAGGFDWLADGRRMAYMTTDNKLVTVDVTARGSHLDIGPPQPLMGGKPAPFALRFGQDRIGLTPDGRRILASVPIEEESDPLLTLVTNWAGELERM